MNPSPSWSTIPVKGTWRKLDGTPHAGSVRFTVSTRVVSNTDDVIFPAGSMFEVQLGAETGAIAILLPAVDDPDNTPADWSIKVEEKLAAGGGQTYYIQPRLADLPSGVNLREVVLPTATSPAPSLIKGVAGGLAVLDSDGDLVDASGSKVIGSDPFTVTPRASEDVSAVRYRGLTNLWARLASRDFRSCDIVWLGDSHGEGQGASAKNRRALNRLQANLRYRFPANGSTGGAVDPAIPAWRSVYYQDSKWATEGYTGSGVNFSHDTYGAWGQHVYDFAGPTGTRTWTFKGTSAKLVYLKGGGNRFYWQLDGGVKNYIDAYDPYDLASVSIYSGASGTHTVTVGADAGQVGSIVGLLTWDGDESQGIRVHDWTRTSWKSGDFLADLPIAQAATRLIQPAAFLIELGSNDFGNGISPTTVRSNIEQLMAAHTAALSYVPSFVLVGATDPDAPAGSLPYQWRDYLDQFWAMANDHPDRVSVIELSSRMPKASDTASGLFSSDHLHWSDSGHALAADILTRFLSPS